MGVRARSVHVHRCRLRREWLPMVDLGHVGHRTGTHGCWHALCAHNAFAHPGLRGGGRASRPCCVCSYMCRVAIRRADSATHAKQQRRPIQQFHATVGCNPCSRGSHFCNPRPAFPLTGGRWCFHYRYLSAWRGVQFGRKICMATGHQLHGCPHKLWLACCRSLLALRSSFA